MLLILIIKIRQEMIKKIFLFLALNLPFLSAADIYELNTIEITGNSDDEITERKVGQRVKSDKNLAKEQVSDTKDLVRFETGISVVEGGRFGTSGYAIRGVDENRVAIIVDGLAQAQTISSQGFNELFMGYGNFNNTRNGVEIETLRAATIQKGADSVKTGSGALGGSVIFETKDARDYLGDKNWAYGLKTGFATKNDEFFISHTLAAKAKWFDLLIVRTDRNAKETKNYGYDKYDDKKVGKTRQKADPYDITKNSTLIKISFNPNETNRITFMGDFYNTNQAGHDFSYSFTPSNLGTGSVNAQDEGFRFTDDEIKRKNFAVSLENYDENLFYDTAKFTFSNQKITARAKTEEKCQDKENCTDIINPAGISVKNGKIVDKWGGDFKYLKENGERFIVDSKGNKYHSNNWEYQKILTGDKRWYDCSIFNCDNLEVDEVDSYNTPTGTKKTIKLNLRQKDPTTGKIYGAYDWDSLDPQTRPKYWDAKKYAVLMPFSKGYLDRSWKERDLNTNTKQINADFTKELEIYFTNHSLEYGGLFSKEQKEMINKSGYDGSDARWWAQPFQGIENGKGIKCGVSGGFNGFACPKYETNSFLIPVETTTMALYVKNYIKFNDFLAFDLAYRRDKTHYETTYDPRTSPKIPDDMVKDLYIKPNLLPQSRDQLTGGKNFWDLSSDERAKIDQTINENKKKNEKILRQNAIDNIKYFSQPKDFDNNSYLFGLNLDPFEFLRLQLKYSKAFRNPTSDELYFTYKHPDFTIAPNWNLNPEIAKTEEMALTLYDKIGHFSFSVFKSNYDNFIDLKYIGSKNFEIGNTQRLNFYIYQNINRQKAFVNGHEIDAKLNLGEISQYFSGFYLTFKQTYQKGRFEDEKGQMQPINAIDPKKSVYSLGYATKNAKYGFDFYLTQIVQKSAKDTYNMYWEQDKNEETKEIKYRSAQYSLLDLITFAKPIKNLTLTLGIYNIADKKYLSWSSARSIRRFGTSNLIDQKTGAGIERFYEPGRNAKFTFEYMF